MRAFILFSFILLFLPLSVNAEEVLSFKEAETRRELQAISLSDNNSLIAKDDLNNDLIDEYVLQDCGDGTFCDFSIVAFKDFNPITIGTFKAHKIVVSREKTYGVRNLIVYNQQYNDFAFQTASWDPFSFSYKF